MDKLFLQEENGDGGNDFGESGPPSDLFTEIHGGEFAKLEKKIETAENERIQLAKAAAETKAQLERSREEIQVIMDERYLRYCEEIHETLAERYQCWSLT